MSFRRAARKDANHPDIVRVFRRLGWYVLDVSQLKNCCDLIVSKRRVTFAIEIKDGEKSPSEKKLTEGEQTFMDEWKGHYRLIESESDVLQLNSEAIGL